MNPIRMSTLSLMVMMSIQPCQAGLQQEMDSMFGAMTNATNPTANIGQRRGVLSGGSVVTRNRIMNTNPIAMVPPSFGAGCGGIDLYGGSFSFVNQNQFMTLMRSIASNAGGYAFQLAINAMCPDCGNVMTDLQKKIQQMNQMFSNSCQLAQGIVNDGVSAIDAQNKSRMSNASLSRGVSDVFGSWTGSGPQGDPVQQVANNAPQVLQSTIQGNLVWRALNQSHAANWFAFGGNDLLESIMSVTGSIIVQAPVTAPDGQGSNTPVVNLPPLLKIRDLINGSGTDATQTVRVYQCDSSSADGCLNPTPQNVTVQGLSQKVRDLLLGSTSQDGLINKFATNNGSLTESEKAFMEATPGAIGALIRNLAREDIGLARMFAEEGSPVIALEMAQLMIQGMVDAVRQSTAVNQNAYATKLAESLAQVRLDLHEEYSELAGRYGNTQTLMAFYQDLMRSLKPGQYGSYAQAPKAAPTYPAH
ncbi:MAG: conjugal transfer protein [Gammaproteobacteria bacterium]|nr:conjugal transfer protein [Gammaproteobacteria bacterium]NBT43344.1 conjugal transfer protein [Gammaproteobacteria bacterium]NBY21785.1 conjugal transfer protein [Gammaproteobacteria bacterium]